MAFMLVVSLYTGFDIASQLAGLQADLEGNLASWADSSISASQFDRLCAQVTTLLLNFGLGPSLISWDARHRIS